MLSKPSRGSVETPWGCRSSDRSRREKQARSYGIPMEYLWSTYGIPMEYLWSNTVPTPCQYRANTVPISCRFRVSETLERRWGLRGFAELRGVVVASRAFSVVP